MTRSAKRRWFGDSGWSTAVPLLSMLALFACDGGSVSRSSSLTEQTDLPAGDANCPAGGVQIATGFDGNGNGELDAEEVTETYTICNGAGPSNQGTRGAPVVVNAVSGTAYDFPFAGEATAGGISYYTFTTHGPGSSFDGPYTLRLADIESDVDVTLYADSFTTPIAIDCRMSNLWLVKDCTTPPLDADQTYFFTVADTTGQDSQFLFEALFAAFEGSGAEPLALADATMAAALPRVSYVGDGDLGVERSYYGFRAAGAGAIGSSSLYSIQVRNILSTATEEGAFVNWTIEDERGNLTASCRAEARDADVNCLVKLVNGAAYILNVGNTGSGAQFELLMQEGDHITIELATGLNSVSVPPGVSWFHYDPPGHAVYNLTARGSIEDGYVEIYRGPPASHYPGESGALKDECSLMNGVSACTAGVFYRSGSTYNSFFIRVENHGSAAQAISLETGVAPELSNTPATGSLVAVGEYSKYHEIFHDGSAGIHYTVANNANTGVSCAVEFRFFDSNGRAVSDGVGQGCDDATPFDTFFYYIMPSGMPQTTYYVRFYFSSGTAPFSYSITSP